MIEYLAVLASGVAAGVFTGLVPGLHPNTVVFSSLPVYFSRDVDYLVYSSFVSGLSVSHTFHDFLPAIFIGTPDAESALSALPGAEMAARGEGLEAFNATLYGGVFSTAVFVAASPLLFLFLSEVYSFLQGVMAYVLLFFLLFVVLKSDSPVHAALVALMSGFLGVLAFDMPVNQQFVLLPVFSGLFAVPSLARLVSATAEVPEQDEPAVGFPAAARGGLTGFLAGLMSGIFPGLGPAISTSFLSPMMEGSREEFLAGLGAVNTSDIMVSFLALLLIGKARTGASVALQSISTTSHPNVFFLLGASLVSVSLSVPVAFRVSRLTAGFLDGANLRAAAAAVLLLVSAATAVLTGLPGLLLLLTAGCIGYAAMVVPGRQVCMAVLLVPSILSYGAGIFI